MAKSEGGGTGTVVVVIILLFILFACGVVGWMVLAPVSFHAAVYGALGATPDEFAAQRLNASQQENAALRGNLTASQQALGAADAQLANRSLSRFFWWALIVAIVAILVIGYVLWRIHQQRQGLTIDQADAKYNVKSRKRYAFDGKRYPMVRSRPYQVQRVKQDPNSTNPKALMFFLEYQFVRLEGNRYIKGLEPPLTDTVTVAILNVEDEYHQQWFPFRTLKMALREAHEAELWGFAMQKESLRDQVNDLIGLDAAKNINEVKAAVAPPEEEAA